MTQRHSQNFLADQLSKLSDQIVVGATYLHYKQQHAYIVLHIAINVVNDEPCVVYQALYGNKVIFTRPVKEWDEKVVWQGKTVSRFTQA